MQELVQFKFLAEAFQCHVHHFQCLTVQALKMMQMASKASAKNLSKLNKFLHSEVNQLMQLK